MGKKVKVKEQNIEWEILFRHIYGTLDPDEQAGFEEWYDADPAHRDYYRRMKKEWSEPVSRESDIRRLTEEFDRIYAIHSPRGGYVISLSRFAAAAVVLLVVGLSVWMLWTPESSTTPGSAEHAILPGTMKAILVMEDGTTVNVNEIGEQELNSADVNISIEGDLIAYGGNSSSESSLQPVYHKVIIPRGGEHRLRLSDGTVVWLNSETVLRFPVNNAGDVREVTLSGEAYFEVAKDESRPFTVETDMGEVRVLGTEFNVKSYPADGGIKTTLASGSVVFSSPDGKQAAIQPGWQAEYTPAGGIVTREINLSDEIAWKSGKLSFQNESLSQIMETLARWYDIEITFAADDIGRLSFTGSIDRYEDFRSFVELFEASAPIMFRIDGRKLTIDKK